tara:strand:- start:111 stop:611 length:501 start_codon:yes stop_codon:yes gene_type:complete
MKYCIDCNKKIDKRSTRCNPCKAINNAHKITGDKNPTRHKKPCEFYNWKGGKPNCVDCGKKLSFYGYKRCRECYSKYSVGENHPNWEGGKSFIPYPLGWTRTFKEQIRYRDKYTCQKCGIPEVESARKLCVHHKDLDKNNLEVNNLISLCLSCHMKTHWRVRKFVS